MAVYIERAPASVELTFTIAGRPDADELTAILSGNTTGCGCVDGCTTELA